MERKKDLWPRLAAGALVVAVLAGVALAAGQQGSQDDPLVTMSYLEKKVTPEIMAQLDEKIAQREERLTEELRGLMEGYLGQMEEKLAQAGGEVEQAVFSVVDVAKGQKLIGGVGCELMLRVGTAKCLAPTEPGLIDMTGGAVLPGGSPLETNHLYMVTVGDRGLQATSDGKILVRGSYTLQ